MVAGKYVKVIAMISTFASPSLASPCADATRQFRATGMPSIHSKHSEPMLLTVSAWGYMAGQEYEK